MINPIPESVIRAIGLLVISIGLTGTATYLRSHEQHYSLGHWKIRELSVAELEKMTDRLLVDARSREHYKVGHIGDAIWLAEETWDETLPTFLDTWRPEHPVVIYCDGGGCAASKRVALRLLEDLPEAQIYVLKGGFPAWRAAQ